MGPPAGLCKERLAFDAEVDRSYVGGLDRLEENPTVDLLDRLAKTLEVPISELFKQPRVGDVPPKPLQRSRNARMPQLARFSTFGPKLPG
jgi:transcriptional regulator with XRE-family HTH domain